mgnify:CR=1 FL=1
MAIQDEESASGLGKYDMDNPMDFHDLAVLDGWSSYVNTDPKKEFVVGKVYPLDGKYYKYLGEKEGMKEVPNPKDFRFYEQE